MSETMDAYPAKFDVDYPERDLSKTTTFFRIFTVIPIAIVLSLVTASGQVSTLNSSFTTGAGILFLAPGTMILFRRKYPRWWFDWNLAFTRFGARVGAYLSLLRDEYPSTEDEQAVHIEIPYPDAEHDLNRWLPLVKWLL